MWHPDTSRGREAQKIAPWAVQYLEGKGFDIGCGAEKVVAWATGVDLHTNADVVQDGAKLDTVADQTVDFVFSSHFIEHVPDWKAALEEWWRVIKVGGHLVLYWPHPHHYPRIGQFGANPDHKHDIDPFEMWEAMLGVRAKSGYGFVQVEDETRSGGNEYSQFAVFRKHTSSACEREPFKRNPDGRKRAVVIRYGAIGDIISATSVIPGLKREGYHVTFACSREGRELLRDNPHIDAFIGYPNTAGFWMARPMLEERFDKIVNLTQTFEGMVLAMPESPAAQWPASARRKALGIDYLTLMACIAEQTEIGVPEFHPDIDESRTARSIANNDLTIAWALKGSAPQKWYPWVPQILTRLLLRRPDAKVVLLAGPEVKDLADKIVERVTQFAGPDAAARIVNGAGRFSIRQSLAVINACHVAIGVETGLMWAVARKSTPKVLLCSHSDPRQFSTWINTQALHSRPACGPCLMLISDWKHCHRMPDTGAARCQNELSPETVMEALEAAIENQTATQERAA